MIEVVARRFSDIVRKSRNEQASIKAHRLRHANGLTVQSSAMSLNGSEDLIARRIDDYAKDTAFPKLQPDRHTVSRIAMSKIRRAVKRVNDPEIGRWGLFHLSSFLRQDAMERESFANVVDDALFGRMIRVGYEIDRALVFDMETRLGIALEKRARFPAGCNSGFKKGFV